MKHMKIHKAPNCFLQTEMLNIEFKLHLDNENAPSLIWFLQQFTLDINLKLSMDQQILDFFFWASMVKWLQISNNWPNILQSTSLSKL